MLNRRFLRIKVFQALYGIAHEENVSLAISKKQLFSNLEKTYELYLFILSFPSEFLHFIEQELELQNSKYFPAEQLIQGLQAIKNNQLIQLLHTNSELQENAKKVKGRWQDSLEFSRKIYQEIRTQEFFNEYTTKAHPSFTDSKQFLLTLFEFLFADSENFNNYVEEIFYNWEDDQVIVLSTIQKMLNAFKNGQTQLLIEAHKDEDVDLKFMRDLFDLTLQHQQTFNEMINAKTQNWEQDRIAMVDILLMRMALCELLYFPYIPVKVSINEYLELAKLYSTPNSHGFINGVLDKIQLQLKAENKISKQGRGLVE